MKLQLIVGLVSIGLTLSAEAAEVEGKLRSLLEGTRVVEAGSIYTNPPSGLRFPEAFGVWNRIEVTAYAEGQQNISIGYDCPVGISGTVYVYSVDSRANGGSVSRELHTAMAAIREANKLTSAWEGLEFDSPTLVTNRLTGGQLAVGHHVRLRFKQRQGDVVSRHSSEIYVFERGTNFLKLRFSYPEARQPAAGREIPTFIRAIMNSESTPHP